MLEERIAALGSGALLGLSAGISPGPLLTLVITETLTYSTAAGVRVALCPILTDLPIILAFVLALSVLAASSTFFGVISLAGAAFLLFLAWHSATAGPLSPDLPQARAMSLRKGIVANFLNPNVYLFWGTVGTPLLFKMHGEDPLSPWCFLLAFYLCIVTAKVSVALATARFRNLVQGRPYVWIMRVIGLALAFFAVDFLLDGFHYLGWTA